MSWKGATPTRQPASPSLNPKEGPSSRSVNWKGGNAEDQTPKCSPASPIPGRINLPRGGGDED